MLIAERPTDLARRQSLVTLRDRITVTLAPVISGYSECALVGFNDSANVGDSAIWLGELTWLHDAGVRVAYRCHERDYDANILAQSCPNGLILLSGGGNLGDVWPSLQRLRERVIQDFPRRPIVQLPQSIQFGDREALALARRVFDNHPDLTIFVRDVASLDFANREFQCGAALCPDMALYLGALSFKRVKDVDVLWLKRTDREAVPDNLGAVGSGMVVTDWLHPWPPAVRRLRETFQPLLMRHPRRLGVLRRYSEATFDYQARQRMKFGCALLSRGSVVVTDRLHGHILSLLLGIPHVVLDNSYGKVRQFHETWTKSMPHVRWAESPTDARAAAKELLAWAC